MIRSGLVILALAALAACNSSSNGSKDLANPGGTTACKTSADCPSNLPMCHPDSLVCVGCIDSFQTCGAGLTCDQKTHTCVPANPNAPCTRNADCPRPGFDPGINVTCERDGGRCVECVTNVDCVSPDICHPEFFCGVPDAGPRDLSPAGG